MTLNMSPSLAIALDSLLVMVVATLIVPGDAAPSYFYPIAVTTNSYYSGAGIIKAPQSAVYCAPGVSIYLYPPVVASHSRRYSFVWACSIQ